MGLVMNYDDRYIDFHDNQTERDEVVKNEIQHSEQSMNKIIHDVFEKNTQPHNVISRVP